MLRIVFMCYLFDPFGGVLLTTNFSMKSEWLRADGENRSLIWQNRGTKIWQWLSLEHRVLYRNRILHNDET